MNVEDNLKESSKIPKVNLEIEYFYKGEKITDIAKFKKENKIIFDNEFPSEVYFLSEYNKNVKFKNTHKLIVSERGITLIPIS